MAFIPVPNVAMAELRFTQGVVQMENTLYFDFGAPITIGDMNALGEYLATWWESSLQSVVSDTISLNEVYVTDLTSDSAPAVSVTGGLPLLGANVADPCPSNVTIAVSFRTAGRGRSARGRNYFIGMVKPHVAGNTVSSVLTDALRDAYALLQTGVLADVGCQWVVVSRFHNGVPRATGIAQHVTNAVLVDSTVDSQRRRLPGRGQ